MTRWVLCFTISLLLLWNTAESKRTGGRGEKSTGEKVEGVTEGTDLNATIKALEKNKAALEKSGNKADITKVSLKLAESYIKAGKYPKAIKELDQSLKTSISLKDDAMIEKSYELLYLSYEKSGNEKKATEYFGYYNSFKTDRENRNLARKNKLSELQINRLKEQKLMSELGKQEVESQLEQQTTQLLQTKDSLALLDLLNKQTQAQISLLQKEKEVKDLKVREQDAKLKIKELALKQKDAEIQMERMVMYGLLAIILMTVGLAYVMYRNYKQKQAANAMIEEQLVVIQSQHTNITNSINYAQRIQNAMLPGERAFKYLIEDSFILFKPKDIVSGDFYWFYNVKTGTNLNEYDPESDEGVDKLPVASDARKVVVAAVDCTGHGVPGALMSMIGYNLLNMIVARNILESDKMLAELNKNVRFALQQYKNDNKDGMDMALCVIDKDKKTLEFSGAKNPLVYIQDGELVHVKGDSHPIGGSQGEARRTYQKHTISIEKPTSVYLFSDGYPDQFGGPESRKFMIKNLKELLLQIHQLPFDEQKSILDMKIEEWKGDHEKQIDDILVMGMRVGG